MASANLKQLIYKKITYLTILGMYKIHTNIKNRICKHSDDLRKTKKTETKNILVNKKTSKGLVIYLTRYVNFKYIKKV